MNKTYEWGVMMTTFPHALHRGPYEDEDEAREWLAGAIAAGVMPDAFVIIRRKVGAWKVAK